ncbi:MAG: phosphoglycerate kinase, partial [Pseudomonadota bacterium]|nr:phosphoglycerate kinase [Pseudomonadota bacterium]
LLDKTDCLIVGGGIANTFLAATGKPIGASLYEPDLVDDAKRILLKAEKKGIQIPLPIDIICGEVLTEAAIGTKKLIQEVSAEDKILDIGPQTSLILDQIIKEAQTIIWNGPIGVFELPAFADGTRHLAQAIAKSTAFSIAGGGDTLAAITKFNVTDDISYISTGGGAFLEYIEGRTLPAVNILEKRGQLSLHRP